MNMASFTLARKLHKISLAKMSVVGRVPPNSIKVFVCGYGRVGQTTLVRTLQSGVMGQLFDVRSEGDITSTVGFDVQTLVLDGKQFSIWDYGGQMEVRSHCNSSAAPFCRICAVRL